MRTLLVALALAASLAAQQQPGGSNSLPPSASGGVGGTVTEVKVQGTANQISVSGGCDVTTNNTASPCIVGLAAVPILPNGTTATTQSQADGSAKLATTAYVDTGLATKGTGTVNSVGFTGGLISVANPTTAPAFTVAGTSGGVPYFSGANMWASSAAGTVNHVMGWGGAGSAPVDLGALPTGTVTSIATTSPITGGTITATGTIACATCVTSAASLTSGDIMYGTGSQGSAVLPSMVVTSPGLAAETLTILNPVASTGITNVIVKAGAGNAASANAYMFRAQDSTGHTMLGASPLGAFLQPGFGISFCDQNIIYPCQQMYSNSEGAIDFFAIPTTGNVHGAFNMELRNGFTNTSGTMSYVWFSDDSAHGFTPTSGTAVFNGLWLAWPVTQTGGANGITRGMYVNPTAYASLTAADYRGIEISNLGSTMTAIKTGTGKVVFGDVTSATLYATATVCANAASPAVCAAAPDGSVAIPTGVNPTLTVNTTAVTASSVIGFWSDDSVTIAATTCNSTLATLVGGLTVTARVPGTSFTLSYNGTITTNPLCVTYKIEN